MGFIPFKRKNSRNISLYVFGPMWGWSKIYELQKERERKDCTGVPKKADSSIVTDVFSSPIIKLQRP